MQTALFLFWYLVEGEPNSPELFFFNEVISKIIDETKWSGLSSKPQVHVVEVGGSSSFKTFAKISYRLSTIHREIPVLAIIDSDYRIESTKKQDDNSKLIKDQIPQILYWPRHEWENYLLEETKWLADWINEIPVKPAKNSGATKPKRYKNISTPATSELLVHFLVGHFRDQIREEYWECLKFNLDVKIEKYPSIEKPSNFNIQPLKEIKEWFKKQANLSQAVVTLKEKKEPEKLFDDIMKELPWETWLVQPDFELAKQRFRGKEAFVALGQFVKREFGIHHFDQDLLTGELLRYLVSEASSAIFQDLKNLLLPELS